MTNYHNRILQLYIGEAFDKKAARTLALAAGYEGGPGVGTGNGNVSGLARDVLGLPVEAGPELRALIEKWRVK